MNKAFPGDSLCERLMTLGSLGNVLEMDDVDKRALLHPGPVVVPAVLSLAIEHGERISADDVLDAIVRGYEAMIRVGRAVGPEHYRYWHNTGTCGPFGAAAATASLLGLNEAQTSAALGLAGTQASGLWQVRHEPESHAKQLHTARAAHAGVSAAGLVNAGFEGLHTIFEGPQGFFAATCERGDPYAMVETTGSESWLIHDVSFKPWAACRHAHAAIDAALALNIPEDRVRKIKTITVRTYADAITFCDRPDPETVISAKFSLQHAVAVCLLKGPPTLGDFEMERVHDPALTSLREKITVSEDVQFTEVYPARFGAGVDVVWHSGEHESFNVNDALGDPENPLNRAQLCKKAETLMVAGGLSAQKAQELKDICLELHSHNQALPKLLVELDRELVA